MDEQVEQTTEQGFAEQTDPLQEVEVGADDALMLNVDVDDIADAPPFINGEKLLTVEVISVVKKEGKQPYLSLQLKLENDDYKGMIFENIIPPHPSHADGGVFCKRRWNEWMSILGIIKDASGWHYKIAQGKSFYAMVAMSKGDAERDPAPHIKKLVRAV